MENKRIIKINKEMTIRHVNKNDKTLQLRPSRDGSVINRVTYSVMHYLFWLQHFGMPQILWSGKLVMSSLKSNITELNMLYIVRLGRRIWPYVYLYQ